MENINRDVSDLTNTHEVIFAERVEILHKNLLVSVPANFVCATVVFIGLYYSGKNPLILGWYAAVIFISLFRLMACYFYFHYPRTSLFYLRIFILGMTLSAALWGVADSLLMPAGDLLQQMIIIVIVAGITAGGLQTLNANLTSSLIYVSLIVTPLCVWLLLQNGLTYLVLGIVMTTYLFFILITAMRGCKLLEQALTLHYENLALINNLSISNEKLSRSYKMLEQHEFEMALINKMNDTLQTCQQSNEAYEIILITAKELFKKFSGGLVILNSSMDELETVNQWGDNQSLKSVFTIADCWALRKGHNYLVNDSTKDLPCHHFNVLPNAYICVPLSVQSGILGLLVIHSPVKDNLTGYLLRQIISFCEVIQLSLANIKLREALYEQAIHDPLTGLFNRRYMDETLMRELQRTVRDKKSLCVGMLDLDFFKRFNDANGHEAGDEVLKYIGALLKENFRMSDVACRFGGEEFVVVLVDSDLSTAYQRLERFRAAVKKGVVHFHDQILPSITVSIGVAEAPMHGTTVKDIIRAADEALYSAKQAGRDRVERFSYVTRDSNS